MLSLRSKRKATNIIEGDTEPGERSWRKEPGLVLDFELDALLRRKVSE